MIGQEIKKRSSIFKTYDAGLAAYLLMKGFKKTNQKRIDGKVIFYFENKDYISQMAWKYMNGGNNFREYREILKEVIDLAKNTE